MAGAILALDALGVPRGVQFAGMSPYWLALGALNVVLAALVFVIVDRGRILSPAYSRISARQLAALRAMSVASPIAPPEGD